MSLRTTNSLVMPARCSAKNPKSADFISEVAGTTKTWKETERVSKGWLFEARTGEKSVREVEEFLVHPNVIKRLRVGEAVVVKKYPAADAYVIKVDSGER